MSIRLTHPEKQTIYRQSLTDEGIKSFSAVGVSLLLLILIMISKGRHSVTAKVWRLFPVKWRLL